MSSVEMENALPISPENNRIVSSDDPLAACLGMACKALGRPASPDSLCAGLPLEDGRLTPALFVRAAERAGLNARVVETGIADISPLAYPVVLLLKEKGACLMVSRDDGRAEVVMPEAGEGSVLLSLQELESRYSGHAIFVNRTLRFSAGTVSEYIVRKHHWFWGTLARSKSLYGEVALASVFVNAFTVLSPLFFMNVYDRVVPNKAIETLWVLAIGVSLMYVFDFVLKALRGYFVDVAGKRADLALSSMLFEQLMGIRLGTLRQPAGALANNLREFESLRDFFTSATIATLIDLPFVVLFLAVIYLIGGYLVVAPLVAIPFVLAVGFAVQAPLGNRIRKVFCATEAKHGTLIESLGAIETVKSLGAASHLQRQWEDLSAFAATHSLGSRFLAGLAVNFAGFMQLLVAVGVVVLGVYKIAAGELTTGGLIACTIIAGRSLAPFAQVAALLTRYHQAMSALNALNAIMETETERPAGKTFVHRPVLRGDISFKNVAFAYPGQPVNALNGASFSIAAGDRVAIIGRIGSGKSTLAKLLLSLYQPTSGSILVDGVDIRQIDPVDLRRNIGYVPQNLVLFSGSVRENLVIGAPHVEDEVILRAAAIAGLDEHVNRHPQGFDMPVGERGDGLSGGQRQTVAVARALLLDPPILVLDEPTHAMDQTSEEGLKKRLTAYLNGKTLIVVTHRPSLLSLVDKLLVMEGGKPVAFGPKEAVLKALADGKIVAQP